MTARAARFPTFKAKKTPALMGSVHIHRDIFDQLRKFATKNRVTMASAAEVAVVEMVRRYEKVRP